MEGDDESTEPWWPPRHIGSTCLNSYWSRGSCGSVGRAVVSGTRGPGFESSFYYLLYRKDENKEKSCPEWPVKKTYVGAKFKVVKKFGQEIIIKARP